MCNYIAIYPECQYFKRLKGLLMNNFPFSKKPNMTQFQLSKYLYLSGILCDLRLTPSTKLVLVALCQHYNPDKADMFPSQAFIARVLGISEKSVTRAIADLKHASIIACDKKRVNHYVLTDVFFARLKMSLNSRQIDPSLQDKLSHKQIIEQKKNSFSSNPLNPRAVRVSQKTVEETKKEMDEIYSAKGVSPLEDFECALKYLDGLTPQALNVPSILKSARNIAEKWRIEHPILKRKYCNLSGNA